MSPSDVVIRNATYAAFVDLGRAPGTHEVAERLGVATTDVLAAWRRLHEGHALVLDDNGAILMANPFSAIETPHRVEAAGRTWFANCGWDAFGIGAALGVDCSIHTTCPDCSERVDIEVRGGRPLDESPVFHVLVPAREWWTDIRFT
ncbi:MAG: hypothetical protein EPO00_09545 [Chloroflexota bacterium]|nr:MAG: hypothetical protein EPO00_09545 [Chloroflexota bacterium]